jgi:hypothetical protein
MKRPMILMTFWRLSLREVDSGTRRLRSTTRTTFSIIWSPAAIILATSLSTGTRIRGIGRRGSTIIARRGTIIMAAIGRGGTIGSPGSRGSQGNPGSRDSHSSTTAERRGNIDDHIHIISCSKVCPKMNEAGVEMPVEWVWRRVFTIPLLIKGF